MPPRRLPGPPGDLPATRVTFHVDGSAVEGIEGEPVAASLLAADRLILSRSFRFHRPRGLMCSTGQCGWCECEIDGRPSVRSCRVELRAGMVVRGEHAVPSVQRDLLAVLDLGSRWIPPTFYHHRFLRPRRLRKRFLDVLRWFGGRGRLAEGRTGPPGRPTRALETNVLVVGGGRAGLAAALGAAEAGGRVILIEAERDPGAWRLEPPVGSSGVGTTDLARAVRSAGVRVLGGVGATGWYGGTMAALGEDAAYEIRASTVVVATGSYDRVPLVPGADRPGVISARTVAWLIGRHGIVPGERVLLVGDGPDVAEAARQLAGAGVTSVVGPVETADLLAVRGGRRVTGAEIRADGQRRRLAVDIIAFGDRSPNLDLVLAAGGRVESTAGTVRPILSASGRTSAGPIFVAGSAAGRPVDGPHGFDAARRTGQAAAAAARGGGASSSPTNGGVHRPASSTIEARHGRGDAVPPPGPAAATVCFCEDVRVREVRAEQAAGYGDPELLKRRTGALTGPCQGKYCLQAFAALAGPGADGALTLPTGRPPLRPIRLGDLVDAGPDSGEEPAEPAEVTEPVRAAEPAP